MSQRTAIEWTDLSWNPVHGCSKVSPGCAHCYAETLSLRYKQTLKPWTPKNAAENVVLKPHKLREPLSGGKLWREPKRVFVNSTSDLFHELVPDEFIESVFAVMACAQRHTFQIITKRPERMASLITRTFHESIARLAWELAEAADLTLSYQFPLPNVWLGTSIENRRFVHRADLLRETPAAVRFISAEPLLGQLLVREWASAGPRLRALGCLRWDDGKKIDSGNPELDLTGIDWLIVGGESGRGHRPMHDGWVRDLRDAALANACPLCAGLGVECPGYSEGCPRCGDRRTETAFFFKQWGGRTPKSGGRVLDGREWSEFPGCAGLAVAA